MTTITASLVTCAGFICVGGGMPAHFMDRAAAMVAETKLKGIPMTNEPTAFELPPVPEWAYEEVRDNQVKAYGHACAEAARAPLAEENARLLARIAELESLKSDFERLIDKHAETLTERDRLRAEVEAKAGEVESLRGCLAECLDDLSAEINARALGELPRRIERDLAPVRRAAALLAQPAGEWVNPLAAEVEKLRASMSISEALDEYEARTKALPCQHEIPERGCSTYNWQMAAIRDLRAIAARKGATKEPTPE